MSPSIRTLPFLLVCITYVSAVVQLSPCVDNGRPDMFAEVKQSSVTSFSCSGLTSADTVYWNIVSDSGQSFTAGSCARVNSCSGGAVGPNEGFTLTRPTSTSSTMTINTTVTSTATAIQTSSLRCDVGSQPSLCKVDLITAGQASCTVEFNTTTTPWSVTGNCSIAGAQSTRSRYYCTWYRATQDSQDVFVKDTTFTNEMMICRFSETLPTQEGQYSYRVKVTPGQNVFTSSFGGPDNEIKRPQTLTTACTGNDEYVREFSQVTCTCSTSSVGKPPGRLLWRNATSDVNRGDAGQIVLPMTSSSLARGNHVFTCSVVWATNGPSSSVTVPVGYKPEQLSFNIGTNNTINVTVNENDRVTFTCNASAVPSAILTLYRQDGKMNSSGSPLSHVIERAQCGDIGLYNCSAINSLGQADPVTKQLFVTCSPRSDNTNLGILIFRNTIQRVNFDATAYPAPKEPVIIHYLGVNGTDFPTDPRDVDVSATCIPTAGRLNQFFCTLTLTNVTSARAGGHYLVVLTNTKGSQNFTFLIQYNEKQRGDGQGANNDGAVIGGVIGAVVSIIVVVVIVVLVVIRKRRGKHPHKQLSSARPRPGGPRAGSLEGPGMQMGSAETLQGVRHDSSQGPLSFAPPADVYSVVDKSKKTKPSPANGAAAAAEADGAVGGDEYAVVAKDKKADKAKAAANPKVNNKKADKAKAAAKPKVNNKKAGKGKKKGSQADGDANNVYENFTQIGNDGAQAVLAEPAQEEGPHKNADGLLYADLEFKSKPAPKPKKPDPSDNVEYGQLDFERMEKDNTMNQKK